MLPNRHRNRRSVSIGMKESEENHQWAVSYADVLMVLLCFFTIFYSTNKGQKESIIRQLVNDEQLAPQRSVATRLDDQKGPGGEVNGIASAKGVEGLATQAQTEVRRSDTIDTILKTLKDNDVEVNLDNESLTIRLPNDIYELNSLTLIASGEARFRKLIEHLKPHAAHVDLVFVGHTDRRPISRATRRHIKDNFELSSLRAAAALRRATRFGLPTERLFTFGAAFNERDTRSLSIIVKERGKALL